MGYDAVSGKESRRGGGLNGIAATVVAALLMLLAPAAAGAATPTIVNGSSNQWLESGAISDRGGASREVTISVLVKHDPGRRVTALKVDDDYDGSDNASGKSPRSLTAQQPTIVNGYDYSRATLTFEASNSNNGLDCPFVGSGTSETDRNLRVRAVLDDGSETATSSTTLKMVRYDCNARDDFPVITARSQSATQIDRGDTVTFTYTADDSDSGLTGNQTFGGLRYRLRRLSDNATTGATNICQPGDNTSRSFDVTFPNRGRWVVEAELLNENDSCGTNPNGGTWWRIGAVDVNSPAANSPEISLDMPRPQLNGSTTVTATVNDSDDAGQGGVAQDLEWDLDENTGNGVGGFEQVSLGDVASGLTLAQRQRTINTAGKTPGLHVVRARVGDNGALGGADNIRRTKIATTTYRVDHPPVAMDETVQAEAGKPRAITLAAVDGDGDPLSYSISTGPTGGTLAGSGPNRTYTPNPSFAGTDTIVWAVNDGWGGTDTATTTIEVAPDTGLTAGPSGPIAADEATFEFDSPTPAATFECSLDGDEFAACSSPHELTGLGDGPHEIRVRAVAAGFRDPTPATRSFVVDTVDPETTIDSGPGQWSTTATPEFGFSSSQSGSTFECRVDDEAFASCTSPLQTDELDEGEHSFEVRATDPAGNTDATPATRTFTVDTVAPETSIDSGPSGPTGTANPQFGFSSPDSTAAFQCRTDGGAFNACTSPYTTPNLADGPHTVEIRAVDPAGNPDPTPAVREITVDTVPPDTTIDSGPSGFVSDATPSFEFSSTKDGTFECRVDDGAFSACESGEPLPELEEGPHTFEVRAVDLGGIRDGSPASRSFTVDTIDPETTIDSGPSGLVNTATPTFAFSSDEPTAGFECRVDDGDFEPCASPLTTAGLDEGAHTFEVRSVDQAGNADGSAASRNFTVDTVRPETSLDEAPAGTIGQSRATFRFSSEDGSGFECRLDDGEWEECASPLTLLDLGDGDHSFQVRAVDPAGNRDALPPMAAFSVSTSEPDTFIDSGPADVEGGDSAEISFSSDEDGATFECRLDEDDWEECTSPHSLTGLVEGGHVFRVRARDAEGHVDATPAVHSWAVDARSPTVTFLRGPAAVTRDTDPVFEFDSDETASFECQLDDGGWAACTSPHELSALAPGDHRLEVRATDATGNIGTPAAREFSVDTTPPETTIDAAPEDGTDSSEATFEFSSDPGATFTCTLDGEASGCTSPKTYSGLDDGEHTFTVVATDEAGNTDPTPAFHTWTIAGTGPPDTAITVGPSGSTLSRDVSFEFRSNGPGATFECALDGATPTPCTSPHSYAGLATGTHTFEVRATDAHGTDPTPATRTFEIDPGGTRDRAVAPRLTPRKGKVLFAKKPVTVATIACFDGPCELLSASATLKAKKAKLPLKVKAPATLAAGDMTNATVKVGGKAKKALLKAKKGKLTATIQYAVDGAPPVTATAKLKLKTPKRGGGR